MSILGEVKWLLRQISKVCKRIVHRVGVLWRRGVIVRVVRVAGWRFKVVGDVHILCVGRVRVFQVRRVGSRFKRERVRGEVFCGFVRGVVRRIDLVPQLGRIALVKVFLM